MLPDLCNRKTDGQSNEKSLSFTSMANPLKFISMALTQSFGSQELQRTQEAQAITAEHDNVTQYDQVMSTKLAISYAICLEFLHRIQSNPDFQGQKAIDLACGPAHFTLCLKKYLNFGKVVGIDLSPGMVDVAKKNAESQKLENCFFELGDITSLENIADQSFDLASFTDAAHHMPSIDVVQSILMEMQRITKPEGVILVMDLVRLRTKALTETYVHFLGADYLKQGLPNFFNDFKDSMHAAWTTDELRLAIPQKSNRIWFHVYPRYFPSMQFIVGLPVGRSKLYCRNALPWNTQGSPLQKNMWLEWQLARLTLFGGHAVRVS
jgi:ubiquinone/menaquinone biosynthesis C-methylase UbiE